MEDKPYGTPKYAAQIPDMRESQRRPGYDKRPRDPGYYNNGNGRPDDDDENQRGFVGWMGSDGQVRRHYDPQYDFRSPEDFKNLEMR